MARGSSSSISSISTPVVRPGYKECGIQVDFQDYEIDLLMQIYSDRLSSETIEYFYEISHSDFQWTCSQIDEYLQNDHQQEESPISTVQLLDTSTNAFTLEEEISQEFPQQISISSSTIDSLEELYGQLPDKPSTSNEILLPFDEDLSRSIYQAVRRHLTRSTENIKPVNMIDKNQKWKSPVDESNPTSNHVPSMRVIIAEEQRAVQSQKSKEVCLLNCMN